MKVTFAHSRVTLDHYPRFGHVRVGAERAGLPPPRVVVHLKDGDVGHSVGLAESHAGDVERAHQVDPPAHVSAFEDAVAATGTQVAGGRARQAGATRLAEPGLCRRRAHGARNAGIEVKGEFK